MSFGDGIVNESIRQYFKVDTRVTGCGKKVGVNGAYIFVDDSVTSVTLTPAISKSLFGRWLNLEVRYEK